MARDASPPAFAHRSRPSLYRQAAAAPNADGSHSSECPFCFVGPVYIPNERVSASRRKSLIQKNMLDWHEPCLSIGKTLNG
jgi:hypothetical protein